MPSGVVSIFQCGYVKEETILLWWPFVPAFEPRKFNISCLDRFLATAIVLTVGPALFLAHIYLMWLRFFFLSIAVLFLFRFYDTK